MADQQKATTSKQEALDQYIESVISNSSKNEYCRWVQPFQSTGF